MASEILIARLVAELIMSDSGFAQQISANERKLTNFAATASKTLLTTGASIQKLGRGLTLGLTVPLVVAAKSIAETGIEFDKQMRRMNSVAQLPEAALKDLSDNIRDMGVAAGYGPVELAASLYDVLGATDDVSLSTTVLTHGLRVARAGYVDLETANATLIRVMKAYGYEAEDLGYVSDLMFKTIDRGILTMDDYGAGIGYVISNANAAGLSFEELQAALIATSQVLGENQSFTALNRLITNIIKPSKAATKVAKELGLEWGAAALEADGLAGFMRKVADATGGDITKLGQLFTTQQSLTAATALLNNGQDNLTMGLEAVGEAAGATDRALEQVMQADATNIDILKASVEDLAISLQDASGPAFDPFIAQLTKLVDKAREASPETLTLALRIAAIAAAAGPVLLVLGTVIKVIGGLAAVLATPLGVIALLIVGIGLLYLAWKNDLGGIRTTTETEIPKVIALFERLGTDGIQFAQAEIGKFLMWYRLNLPLITQTMVVVERFWNNLWIMMSGVVLTIWEEIKLATSWAMEMLRLFLTLGMQVITGDWDGAWETIKIIASTTWETIKEMIGVMWDLIIDIIVAGLGTTRAGIDQWTIDTGISFQNWKDDNLKLITDFRREGLINTDLFQRQAIIDINLFVETTDKNLHLWAKQQMETIVTFLTNSLTKFGEWTAGVIGDIDQLATDALVAAIAIGTNIIAGIQQGIRDAASSVYTAIQDVIQGILGSAESAAIAHSPAQLFVPLGEDMLYGVEQGMDNVAGSLQAKAGAIVAGIYNEMAAITPFSAAMGGLEVLSATTWPEDRQEERSSMFHPIIQDLNAQAEQAFHSLRYSATAFQAPPTGSSMPSSLKDLTATASKIMQVPGGEGHVYTPEDLFGTGGSGSSNTPPVPSVGDYARTQIINLKNEFAVDDTETARRVIDMLERQLAPYLQGA